jgi:hypothetical protein
MRVATDHRVASDHSRRAATQGRLRRDGEIADLIDKDGAVRPKALYSADLTVSTNQPERLR